MSRITRATAATWRPWLLTSVMICAAAVLFAFALRGRALATPAVSIAWPLLAAAFAGGDAWRVYLHFRRSSHSFSLSEIPLVLGVLCVSPGGVVGARALGALIAFGLIRRHPPIKACFNAALFVLQAEALELALLAFAPRGMASGAACWITALVTLAISEAAGAGLVLLAVTLSDGAPAWRSAVRSLQFGVLVTAVNGGVALEAVLLLSRDPWELWLLFLPIATTAAAAAAYATEQRKHHRMQCLYESSDLLRRDGAGAEALPALLGQMNAVFRTASAELTMLPAMPGDRETLRVRQTTDGSMRVERLTDIAVLDEVLALLDADGHARVVRPGDGDETLQEMLASRGLRDAMVVPLRSEGRIAGTLLVGNRSTTVNPFDADDLQLFETLAAQTEATLHNDRLEGQLKHQAFHDPLTDLANRALFSDRVTHALSRRRADGGLLTCVLFVDLDDFKLVNDSFGHAGGDTVLREVARRLRLAIRPFDTAARIGGDEFGILIEDANGIDGAVAIAERIDAALRQPFIVLDRVLSMRASIGISSASSRSAGGAPDATRGADDLIASADMAMYRAKQLGKGRFAIYEPGMHDEVVARLEMKMELERAIERRQIAVHYQPIVELDTGELVGVEALARWPHPTRGMVPPDIFIPLAEDNGLIEALGEQVLERACGDAHRWSAPARSRPPLRLNVNVSPRQLCNPGFARTVARVLEATGLPPEQLTLEITESWMVPDTEAPGELLAELKELGLKLAIDDFGTGYSSLSALQELPVDSLKIAKPFVDGIAEEARKEAFARAIIRLGQTLSLDLVAEGIETAAQRERLIALGCLHGQGHYFSPAVPAGELEAMLRHDAADATPALPRRRMALAS